MKPLRSFILIAALAPLGLGTQQAKAEETLDLLDAHIRQDRSSFESIAVYPELVRELVFSAAMYPGAIVKMGDIQAKSSQQFSQLLNGYSDADKEATWNLVRFPRLIDELVDGGPKTKGRIRTILRQYPKEIHNTALMLGQREYGLLEQIARLNRTTEGTFENLIYQYSEKTQNNLRQLLQYPELLTLLRTDLDLAVLLGEAYREDPDQLRARAASLHLALAQQQATSVPADYYKSTDDGASEDYSEIADIYAARYQYDTSGFEHPDDNDNDEVTINYYGTPCTI